METPATALRSQTQSGQRPRGRRAVAAPAGSGRPSRVGAALSTHRSALPAAPSASSSVTTQRPSCPAARVVVSRTIHGDDSGPGRAVMAMGWKMQTIQPGASSSGSQQPTTHEREHPTSCLRPGKTHCPAYKMSCRNPKDHLAVFFSPTRRLW